MFNQFWKDEAGFIIAAELVLTLTIAAMSMIVGLNQIAISVNTELNDLSNALGSFNQSYAVTGFEGSKSLYLGSRFSDAIDECDTNFSCDLVLSVATSASEGGIAR